jgi:hypothetical protein
MMELGAVEFATDKFYVLGDYGVQAAGIPSSATAVSGV